MGKLLKFIGVTLLVLLVAFILLLEFGGELLRHPLERFASKTLERKVTLDELRLYPLSLTPRAHLGGLKVGNPAWAVSDTTMVSNSIPGPTPSGQMVDVGALDVGIRLLPLLRGKVVLSELMIDSGNVALVQSLDGRANWTFGSTTQASPTTPMQLPAIEQFVVKNSHLKLVDAPHKLAFTGNFDTAETDVQAGQPFTLDGQGDLNGQPFRMEMKGGTVASIVANKTYPFSLDVKHGATRITAQGTFNQPLNFGDFTANMTLAGRNLADLYYLTGLALPITRDYSLKGALSRSGNTYQLDKLSGKLGGSDLSGNLKVQLGGARPMLTADLASNLLDPADAGMIFGGAPSAADKLLPDAHFDVARLHSMDADVRYRAAAINVDKLPLKAVSVHVVLDNGRLTLDPLALTLPQGTVSGSLVIDARETPPAMTVDMKLTGAKLEDFMAQTSQPDALAGPLVARVKLTGRGDSIHGAASNANGTVAAVIPHGEIRKAFAELLGINAANGLGLLVTDNQKPTPIRCGVASFEAHNGTLLAQQVVVDTGVVRAQGKGTVALATEDLDLTLEGKAKEVRLLHLMVPVRITGTLRQPSLGVNPVKLGAQAGVAVGLGIVLTPLAAILPFVDAGLTQDADCGALMADAKEAGVKGVTRTTPAAK